MKQEQPKLQAPGHGLPWPELAVSRLGLEIYQRTVSPQVALRLLQGETRRILSLLDSVEETKGRTRVLIPRIFGIEDSSRYWSLFMTVEHLNIVIPAVMGFISSLLDRPDYAREVRIQDVKPQEQAGPEQVETLKQNQMLYEKFILSLASLRSCRRHPHPWFGPLHPHGWHCLLGVHQLIHRRQMERILSAYSPGLARVP
ncbi:MAG: hypothetical protein EBZ83_03465 [Verrucomicrobia bacterium]|nr:hypothetical protein [Verrucomicrobiota bacterium]